MRTLRVKKEFRQSTGYNGCTILHLGKADSIGWKAFKVTQQQSSNISHVVLYKPNTTRFLQSPHTNAKIHYIA